MNPLLAPTKGFRNGSDAQSTQTNHSNYGIFAFCLHVGDAQATRRVRQLDEPSNTGSVRVNRPVSRNADIPMKIGPFGNGLGTVLEHFANVPAWNVRSPSGRLGGKPLTRQARRHAGAHAYPMPSTPAHRDPGSRRYHLLALASVCCDSPVTVGSDSMAKKASKFSMWGIRALNGRSALAKRSNPKLDKFVQFPRCRMIGRLRQSRQHPPR